MSAWRILAAGALARCAMGTLKAVAPGKAGCPVAAGGVVGASQAEPFQIGQGQRATLLCAPGGNMAEGIGPGIGPGIGRGAQTERIKQENERA